MASSRTSLVEGAAIVALLAGSAWLGSVMWHNYVEHGARPEAPGARVAPVSIPASTLGGDVATLEAVDERARLLLVLSTTCQFCELNMPNWVRLADRIAELGTGAPEVVVLSVSPAEDTRGYLTRHGLENVTVRLIDSRVLSMIGLTGYPGTVTLTPEGREMFPRAGVLDDFDQARILEWASRVSAPTQSLPATTTPVDGAGGP